jgi:hypothetical protein
LDAGCDSDVAPSVQGATQALSSCAALSDCPTVTLGKCEAQACFNSVCVVQVNPACACTGTTDAGDSDGGVPSTECDDGNPCTDDVCVGGVCKNPTIAGNGCCATNNDCMSVAHNACQKAATCVAGSCTLNAVAANGTCCDGVSQCPQPTDSCFTRTCTANTCGFVAIPGCHNDMGGPDLAPGADLAPGPDLLPPPDLAVVRDMFVAHDLLVPPPPADLATVQDLSAVAQDLAAPGQITSLTGGGGCAVAGHATPAPWLAWLGLTLLALRLRRRI